LDANAAESTPSREQLHAIMAALEERTEAAEQARRAAETAGRAAESASLAKSEFLAMMSHEFRTPLNAMIGYAQLLDIGLAGPLTDQQRSYLGRMSASSEHLLGLVNDVLDLSRIEAGEARIVRDDALTGTATRAALDLVEPAASARGVQLIDVCPEGVPYVGDEHRVRQIVLNLLSNAVKFTPTGGTVTIHCDTQTETPRDANLQGAGPWSYIRVVDTGVGIAPEEHSRIFQPFQQVETGHTRSQGGTGLGLAISRKLAQLMGGDLTVQSALGAGASFTLWLPTPQQSTAADRARAGFEADTGAGHIGGHAHARGLNQVGELLNRSLHDVLSAYADSIMSDPEIPQAHQMRRVLVEDHAISLLSDLAQSLLIVADAGPDAADLLRDGSAIQRAIAEAHGARRYAQGWEEKSVRRDHAIFRREVERIIQEQIGEPSEDTDAAMRVLASLNERAKMLSMRSWRHSAEMARAGL
jgi:signal transduction histidine kinase